MTRKVRAVIAAALVMFVASACANGYKLKALYSGEAMCEFNNARRDYRETDVLKATIFESGMMSIVVSDDVIYLLGLIDEKDIGNFVMLVFEGHMIEDNVLINMGWQAKAIITIPKYVYEEIETYSSHGYKEWFEKATIKEFVLAHRRM